MEELNISKLIDVAENVWHDDQVGFAASISQPVQEVIVNGIKYTLTVKLSAVNEIEFP